MKTRIELIKEVRNSVPPLGAEYMNPVFKKYGYTFTGICDGWNWKDNLAEATTDELWEMLNFSNEYWYKEYKSWYEKSERKAYLLDSFIGECERNYFGYEDDGYSLECIERNIGKIKNVLREKYEH